MDLLTARRNEDFQADPDILVTPDLGDHSSGDYSHFEPLIEAGYEAMKAKIPEIREKLAAPGHGGVLRPRGRLRPPARPRRLDHRRGRGPRATTRVSTRVLRRFFNIPIGPGFDLERGLWAFDKVEATGLLEHAWMEFEPVPEGLRITLVVREAPPNRAEVGAGFTEWEKARGVLRLINRNTFGFGEETSLLLVASEADVGGSLGLRGDMPFFQHLGYRADAYVLSDKPRFFDEEGDKINRADFERRGVDVALQAPLERWGLVEAGLRLGSVTHDKTGIDAAGGRRLGAHALRGAGRRRPGPPALARLGPAPGGLRLVERGRDGGHAPVLAHRGRGPAGPAAGGEGGPSARRPRRPLRRGPAGVRLVPGRGALPDPRVLPRGAQGPPGPGRRGEPALPGCRAAPRAGAGGRRQRLRLPRATSPSTTCAGGWGSGSSTRAASGPWPSSWAGTTTGPRSCRSPSAGTEAAGYWPSVVPITGVLGRGPAISLGAGEGGRSRLAIQRSPSSRESSM